MDIIQEIFLEKIKKYAHELSDTTLQEYYSLGRGIPGLCILYTELHDAFPDEGWEKLAHEKLSFLNEHTDYMSLDTSLYHGLSGIGAAVLSMSKNGSYKSYLTKLNTLITSKLDIELENLEKKIDEKSYEVEDYDLISGCSGILRYFIAMGDQELFSYNVKMITCLIKIVEQQLVDRVNDGVKINLGTAHGLSGVLAVLSAAYLKGINVAGLKETIILLEEFFEAQSFDTLGIKVYPENAPYKMDETNEYLINSSWCYGLTGVNSSLILASQALNDQQNEKKIKENYEKFIEYQITQNRDNNFSTIFCHGLASIVYEYFILDTNLNNNESKVFNLTQLVETLEKSADFSLATPFPDKNSNIQYLNYSHGLIEGSIGVYLVILSLIKNKRIQDDWIFLRS